ncbi:hypothetical protein H4R20_000849, partial [Coemansia guatemalensis]
MKLPSSTARWLAATGMLLATEVVGLPAQHVFAVQNPQTPIASLDIAASSASNNIFNSVSSISWERIESIPGLPNHQLRIKQPKLYKNNSTQYSGYLDTDTNRHFFFWFSEARNAPNRENAPIIVWLNGGPGCSSFTGALMELGPCRIDKGGLSISPNEYGWDDQAHVIFLDQPLNTGFSYGEDVFDSITAGEDVYNFLQLFYHAFPEYSKGELHIFGESYGGHFVPATAKAIQDKNAELAKESNTGSQSMEKQWQRVLPLASIGIANGLTDPLTQYKYYSTMG